MSTLSLCSGAIRRVRNGAIQMAQAGMACRFPAMHGAG